MSNSRLPNGGYSLTNGSNYMLDGFQFDTEYNSGPFDKARLPESKGITALPSGMIPVGNPIFSGIPDGVEADYDMDLSDFTKSATQDISVVDHSWLASQPKPNLEGMRTHEDILEQFAEGRFENPDVNQLKALEGAWGQSTTGLDIIPNSQRKHDKYKNSYGDNQTKLPGDDYREVQEKAMRKLAYGKEAIDEIISEVEGLLSEAEEKAQKVASALKREYGLNGRVYIRERDFPGLFNGRWDEVVNKRCASSLYIISNKEDCAFDRFLGREVIASEIEIDWKRTASILMPKLRSFGVRKGRGSHKEIVKKAFIDLMEGDIENIERPSTWWQVQADPSAGVSLSDAMSALENAEIEETRIASQEEVGEAKLTKKLARIAEQLVAEGFVEEEQVEAVCGCGKTAREKIARLYDLASQPLEKGDYVGQGEGVKYHIPTKKARETKFKSRGVQLFENRSRIAQHKLSKLAATGLISEADLLKIASAHKSEPERAVELAFSKVASSLRGQTDNTYDGLGKDVVRLTQARTPIETEFKSREEVALAQRVARAQTKVAKLVEVGLISIDEAESAASKAKSPEDKVAAVYRAAAQKTPSISEYQGVIDKSEDRQSVSDLVQAQEAFFKKFAGASKAQYEKGVLVEVQRLINASLVSVGDVERVVAEHKSPEVRLQEIYKLATKPLVAQRTEATLHIEKKKSETNKHHLKRASEKDWAVAREKVSKLVVSGFLTEKDVEKLSSIKDPHAFTKKAFAVASKPMEVREYQGDETRHIESKKSSQKQASEMKVSRWLRQKMTEGTAGGILDTLLKGRFSEPTLASLSTLIKSLRDTHEGLSGHAYVDVGAYVTEGIEGCDTGALQHRVNQLPAALMVDKCTKCVFNSDGTCQKYNKVLIMSPADIIENTPSYQKEMIRLSNTSDAERTASLFVNNYDAGEFNLHQDAEFDLEDAPSAEILGDVLFGGFEV